MVIVFSQFWKELIGFTLQEAVIAIETFLQWPIVVGPRS